MNEARLMRLEELSERLKNSDTSEIIRATGLTYNTIKNARLNKAGARYETVKLLSEYFAAQSK